MWIPLLLSGPAVAAEPVEPAEPGPSPLAEAAWTAAALDAARQHLGTVPDGVVLSARLLTFAGGRRARVRYTVHGRPVVGRSLVVASSNGGPMRVRGAAPAWPAAPTEPGIDQHEAVSLAASWSEVAPWHAELAWLARPDGTLRLAWRVPIQRPHGLVPSPHDLWLDATDGEAVALVPTGHGAEALLYPENPVTSEVERWTLPVPGLASSYATAASCRATDPDPSVLELAACEVIEHQAQPDADGNFLFVPRPEAPRDPFAEVGAFAHVDLMSTWLDRGWGFQVAWAPIDVFVNFPLANAFFGDFDGDGAPDVSFGHARGADLAYDADVVYHELGHAVVGTLAPDLPFLQADSIGLDWVSGAINEGAADVFAMLLTDDPAVGEYAGLAFGRATAIRDLARPRTCPRDLMGEVHADGQVLGAVFWQMMQDDRIGTEVAAELLMGAISLWDEAPSWPKIGDSLQATADDLRWSQAIDADTRTAIGQHLSASGMLDCDRIVDLAPGETKDLLMINAGLEGDLERFVGNVQLRLDPVDVPITLRVDKQGGDGVGWSAFVRYGAPVEHRVLDVAGLGLTAAIPDVYDELIDGSVTGDVATFEPGSGPVYVMMASRNIDVDPLELTSVAFGLEAIADRRQAPTPRAEPKDLQHEGGCATAARSEEPWAAAFRRRR